MNNLFGNVVNEYYVRQFRTMHEERRKRLERIRTKAEAELYVQSVRQAIRACFALEKEERSPLNARVTARHEYEHYLLECVILESRPGFYVTGDLYLPRRKEAVPGVLFLCGHNEDGKSAERGTLFNATLASSGIAVFTVDPVCQGERMQFQGGPELENVAGHNMLGKKMLSYGDFFGAWRAFDALRALDYMTTRREIDPCRIFAAGCSGGGTLTAWLNALDDRLAGVMPSCYVTSWLCNVENELPVDAEQTPPGLAGMGLEIADFLIAAAPRPLHLSGEMNDIFDIRGGREAFEDIRHIYSLLGAEEKLSFFCGPRSHGFHPEQRAHGYAFFLKQCGMEKLLLPEDQVTVPAEPDKLAAPGGSVFNLPGNLPAAELLKQRGKQVIARQKPLSRKELETAVAKLLCLPEETAVPTYRILRPYGLNGSTVSRFLLEENREITGVLHHFGNGGGFHIPEGKKCLLYLPHWEFEKELPRIAPDESAGVRFSFDPFGIGELTPDSCDVAERKFGACYNEDYHFASCALMLGESYLGKRAAGVLGALKLLAAAGYEEITLAGAGQSAVTAALVSLLAGTPVTRTLLFHPPESYEALFDRATQLPQSAILYGLLRYADLPRIYRETGAEIKEFSGIESIDLIR